MPTSIVQFEKKCSKINCVKTFHYRYSENLEYYIVPYCFDHDEKHELTSKFAIIQTSRSISSSGYICPAPIKLVYYALMAGVCLSVRLSVLCLTLAVGRPTRTRA